MNQCDLNGNLILEQKTSQNVSREALFSLSQPVLQNHPPSSPPPPLPTEKGHGAVSSEKSTFYEKTIRSKDRKANFRDFFSANNSRDFGLLRTLMGSGKVGASSSSQNHEKTPFHFARNFSN